MPLKDIARTRTLLRLSREKDCDMNRFSVLSLKELDRIFKEFTPEELTFVELITQNKETVGGKAFAGRASLPLS